MIHLTNSWNFMARCFVLCTCKEPLQMAFLWDQIWGVKLVKNHGLLEAKSWISTWSGQGRTPSSWHSCYISGWASKRGQGGGSLCSLGLVSLRLCVSLKALDWGVMLGGGSWKMERLWKFFFSEMAAEMTLHHRACFLRGLTIVGKRQSDGQINFPTVQHHRWNVWEWSVCNYLRHRSRCLDFQKGLEFQE